MSDEKKPGLTIGVVGTGRASLEAIAALAGETITGGAPIKDPIDAKPEVEGLHGRAWLCDVKAGYRKKGISPENDASIGHWIVEAPWAHPCWHSYSLVAIHLRPMPDGRETLIYDENATHELWLYALNPDADRRTLLATGIVGDHWLSPGNFSAQFVEVTDDLARARVRGSVQAICDGRLSPDTDFRREWIRLYGGNMMKDRPGRRPPTVRGGK